MELLLKRTGSGAILGMLSMAVSIAPVAASSGYVGNEACAPCHAAIYNSYTRSTMAKASGLAKDAPVDPEISVSRSGINYRLFTEDGRLWLSFERQSDSTVRGRRELLYYIGSGRRGRTYLFEQKGFLFESPVNWYAGKGYWDITPGYREAREAPLNLPALPECLHCHVSGMRPPVAGTENRYETPAFAYAGVTCERCHGPGESHVKGGPALNPNALSPDRRDSVCMQCHLEGNVAIERPGRRIYQFRPGDLLSDYVRYYVADLPGAGLRALSQFEALAESGCKKGAGNAMSCTSCHDPHFNPTAAERVDFYRGKCLACHGADLGRKHHPGQSDCTGCHMPRSQSADVAHTQVTDHSIPRRPRTPLQQRRSGQIGRPKLTPFPPSAQAVDDLRSLALAWQSLTENGRSDLVPEAERALENAIAQSPDDPVLLSAFGYINHRKGRLTIAEELYARALKADPKSIDAASNLAAIYAGKGRLAEAVALWQDAFGRAPARSGIGLNLARVFCGSGQIPEARGYVERVLQFNPDSAAARKMQAGLNADPPRCSP